MQLDSQGEYLLIVSEYGYGKRTAVADFRIQNRNGKGLKCYKIMDKTGCVVGAKAVNEDNEIMMITNEGIIIRTGCKDISVLSRITSGVKLMNIKQEDGVKVANIAKVREHDHQEPEEEEETQENTEQES